MVSASVITVAPFQRGHNARCATLEWLERSSMRVKRVTLTRSESQKREKFRERPRVSRLVYSPALRVPTRRPLRQRTYPPLKHAYVQALLKSPNERWHVRSLRLKHEVAGPLPCLSELLSE